MVGVIALGRQRVQPFTDRQIELVRTFADQAVIALENARLLGELQQRTDELAARNSEFGERIEHQSATIDVLKAMSASPGDPQPVFDLIVRRARDLCNTTNAGLFEFDGELVHLRSWVGREAYGTPDAVEAYERLFPMVPTRGSITCRAILDRQIIHVRDMATAPGVSAAVRNLGHKSQISLPLLRDGAAIGAMALTSGEIGGFTDSQVALLQTFAEQAVIAITSAETYRELQQRTGDLQESLEYQTATSDVLKVISRSTSDVQPVLDTVVETAARLCGADTGTISIREGEVYRYVASSSSAAEPEYWAILRQRTIVPGRDSVAGRVALEGRVVHVEDILADPDYAVPEAVAAGRRTGLGVPLLREGAVLGTINLTRKRVEPFTERQIELVRTFADQAVIAMENARLLGELQARTRDLEELLEYQTATSDVLKVISRSTADVQPVLDTVTETAARLCGADSATISIREGEVYRYVSTSASAERNPSIGRSGASEPLSPVATASSGGRRSKAGSCMSWTSSPTRTTRRPRLQRPGDAPSLGCRCCARGPCSARLVSRGNGSSRITERQIELVRTFADQAVIAIENARLLGELQQRTDELAARNSEFGERIEHQSATIDVLKAMSASPGDPQPVFDLIARRARDLCNTDTATLLEFDGELVHLRSVVRHAAYVTPDAAEAFKRLFPMVPTRGFTPGRAILDRQTIHVRDIATVSGISAAARALGWKSAISLPLLRDGAAIGAVNLTSGEIGGFTDSQVALLQTFAEQAVIAITSAETYRELQARTDELTRSVAELQALEEVLRAVNSSLDLDTVLATIISRAAQLSQADEGTIYEFDETEEVFVPKSAFGMSAERVEGLRERRVRMGETHLGRAAVERAPVHVEDVQQDPTMIPTSSLDCWKASMPFSRCRCCARTRSSAGW